MTQYFVSVSKKLFLHSLDPKRPSRPMRVTGIGHALACRILGAAGTFRQDIPEGTCRLTPENVSSQAEM